MQKSNFEGSQSQFCIFFSLQFRNRSGSQQYCGIAEVWTKIADAHLLIFVTIYYQIYLELLDHQNINIGLENFEKYWTIGYRIKNS